MKSKSIIDLCSGSGSRPSARAFALALCALSSGQSINAADITWSGATATLNTPSNWVGGALPNNTVASADRWVFGAAGAGGTALTDIRAFGGMLFNAGAPAYTIGVAGNNATWQITSSAITNNSSNVQTINYNLAMSAARVFTGTTAGDIIVNGNLSGAGNIAKTGTNNLTITSPNSTLTNNFTISGGTLTFGASGTVGAKNVGASGARTFSVTGATLAATPKVTLTESSSVQNLVMNAGARFTMVDGFFNTFQITDSTDLFKTTGTAPTYTFNLGGTSSADVLALTPVPTFTFAGPKINITPVSPLTVGNFYTVVTAPGGLDSPNSFVLGTGFATLGNTTYTLSINNTPTSTIIGVTAADLAKAYYSGAQGPTLNAGTPGVSTNWRDAASDGADALFQPSAATEMHFSATGAADTTINTLGQDFTVASLNFNDNSGSVSINDTASNKFIVGTGGINVTGGSHVINVPILLSAPQTITSSAGGAITINGNVNNNNNVLTGSGSGSITINGNITSSAGLVKEGAGTLTVTGSIGGSGGITKNGPGILALNNSNNHSGTTTINQGTISVSTFAAFGTDTTPISMGVTAASGITYTGAGETTTRHFATSGALANSATFTQSGTGMLKLAGNFTVATGNNRQIILDGSTEGTGEFSGVISDSNTGAQFTQLTKNGIGTWTLSGLNTYSNNTLINAGTLILADNAQLKIRTGATSGAGNNTITGAGSLVLDGDFVINTATTDASSLTSGSWQIENVTSLVGAYGSTFTVVGWTDAGGDKWTKAVGTKNYTFDETTGTVTLAPSDAYPAWIESFTPSALLPDAASKLPTADPDNDGISNLLEYAIAGLNPTSANGSVGTLTGSTITFNKRQPLDAGLVYTIQESTDLGISDVWSPVVPTAEDSATITYTLPGTAAKDFVRLNVVKP